MNDEIEKINNAIAIINTIKTNDDDEEYHKNEAKIELLLLERKIQTDEQFGKTRKEIYDKSQGKCDDFKLSDKEFNEIADAMEQVGKNIEKEKQLNDKETKMLEEQFASDEYIEQLRQKQQTDCKKCIYFNPPTETTVSSCIKKMRMSRPICPLFDDGKEVKQ